MKLAMEILSVTALTLLTGYVIYAMIKHNRYLARRKLWKEDLYHAVSFLLTAESPDELYSLLADYMDGQVCSPAIYFKGNPEEKKTLKNALLSHSPEAQRIFLSQQGMEYALHSFRQNACCFTNPAGADGMVCYLPVSSHNRVWGVAAIAFGHGTDKNELEDLIEFFRLYLSNFALAMERDFVVASHTKLRIKAEKDKMQKGMLRAISHDLRTPLTAIIGAANTLLENYNELTETDINEFFHYILDDSNCLLNMVENLLSLARIEDNRLPSTLSDEIVDDLISEAVSKFHHRHKDASLKVRLSDQLITINGDPSLLEQVFLNLLENAYYYSPKESPIQVSVSLYCDVVFVSFKDYGKKERAETKHLSGYPDISTIKEVKGIGINLPVCKAILNAHHGFIVNPPQEDGFLMTIALPAAYLPDETM